MKYDLEVRVLSFSKSLIGFLRAIEATIWNQNIISQLLKSGTSVGANYSEANGTLTKKEFANRISICRREIRETIYWLQIIDFDDSQKTLFDEIYQEARELMFIFNRIAKTLRENKQS